MYFQFFTPTLYCLYRENGWTTFKVRQTPAAHGFERPPNRFFNLGGQGLFLAFFRVYSSDWPALRILSNSLLEVKNAINVMYIGLQFVDIRCAGKCPTEQNSECEHAECGDDFPEHGLPNRRLNE
jgi:hypothetical protein